MNTHKKEVSALSQKMGYYKAVGKQLATNPKVIATTLAVASFATMPEAMANGVTNELNFQALADEAIDSIKNAGKAAMGVFGIGITIVGSFKGYQMLKGGINRA